MTKKDLFLGTFSHLTKIPTQSTFQIKLRCLEMSTQTLRNINTYTSMLMRTQMCQILQLEVNESFSTL